MSWVVAGVTPLLLGWAVALTTHPTASLYGVAWVGMVALTGAVGLGVLLWWRATTFDQIHPRRVAELALTVVMAAALWTWMLYALNPFRMRPVIDALLGSTSVSWQIAAGLAWFGGVVVAARLATGLRQTGQAWTVGATPGLHPVSADPGTTSATIEGTPTEHSVEESPAPLRHLTARVGRRTILIDLGSVERLQAYDDYVAVFSSGRRLLASYRLSELAERLDHERFVRIHRSHIVSISHIECIQRIDANRDSVQMKSGERLPASRRGTIVLRQRLKQR